MGVPMGVPELALRRLTHPPAHPTLLSPSCPCLGISAFSVRLHVEYRVPGREKAGGPRVRSGAPYVLFCPQEQGRDAVLDPEDQPGSCHLLGTGLPSSRQLHEEVLPTSAALLFHPPLPGTSSRGRAAGLSSALSLGHVVLG